MGTRLLAALAVVAGLLAASAGTVEAGGGRLAPVKERYEPGDVATLVGYTGGPALAGVPEDPFYAYLRPADSATEAPLLATDVYVGQLALQETAHGGYLRLRVSLTFEVPDHLPPGDYHVVYCDDPCTGALLGDLVDSPLSIGVDPARRVVREWALDDPEVANLAPGALLVGPDFQATAADVRAGRALARPDLGPAAPPPAPAPAPAPAAAPPPPAAIADPVAPAPPPPPSPADDMAWPLPTALVLASAAGTTFVLRHGARAAAAGATTGRWRPAGGRRPDAAAGRG